jgi:hypothetical protein
LESRKRRVLKLLGNRKLACAAAGFIAMGARQTMADNIGDILDNDASQTVSVGTPSDPSLVVTYVESKAGTSSDGYTYTNWAFLGSDGTGSAEFFGHMPASNSYTPTAGDVITATGLYSPFDGIPEIESLSAISKTGTSGSSITPFVTSVSDINAVAADAVTNPNGSIFVSPVPSPSPVYFGGTVTGGDDYSVLGQLIELDNVTLSATGTTPATGSTGVFPTHANTTLLATDGSSNSVKVFQWASSYSVCGLLGGTSEYLGQSVDMVGFMDIFSPSAEFVPLSITPNVVPEPVSTSIFVLGGAALLGRRRRRRQA